MTDNDIIKALEQCSRDYCYTSECPVFNVTTNEDCRNELIKSAFDLINRQKAEIERLQKAIKVQDIMIEQQDYKLKTVKSEAIKELTERFTSMLADFDDYDTLHIYEIKDRLDLVKEMVGE